MKTLKHKVDDGVQQECIICPLAKKCRLKFPVNTSKSTSLFKLVHLDVWGPYKHPTYDREHYLLTIVDDYTKFTWIMLMQSKKEVVVVLKTFVSMVCNHLVLE